MKRLLVLAYYFPPLGGSGVQRIAKLVKYLPRFGWQPEVLTAAPGRYLAHDPSLLDEVEAAGVPIHRTRSIDPTRIGAPTTSAAPPTARRRSVARVLTEAALLPDNKIGWLPFALKRGQQLLRREPFDAIWSTAPPYTSHLVAARLARLTGTPAVLDYRDDWLENPRHRYPTSWHRAAHERLERHALRYAASITTINETIADALRKRSPARVPVHVVPQGFDPADFEVPPAPRSPGKMRFVYTGMFYDAQRPDTFLAGLARFRARCPEARDAVEALFAGHVPAYFGEIVDTLGLGSTAKYVGYLPHAQSIALARSADVLWMTVGEATGAGQISTSKLFEYMGIGRPILGLVPEGEAARAIRAYGCGDVASPSDADAVASALERAWERWRAGAICRPDASYLDAHDRILIARQVAELLDEIASAPRGA